MSINRSDLQQPLLDDKQAITAPTERSTTSLFSRLPRFWESKPIASPFQQFSSPTNGLIAEFLLREDNDATGLQAPPTDQTTSLESKATFLDFPSVNEIDQLDLRVLTPCEKDFKYTTKVMDGLGAVWNKIFENEDEHPCNCCCCLVACPIATPLLACSLFADCTSYATRNLRGPSPSPAEIYQEVFLSSPALPPQPRSQRMD